MKTFEEWWVNESGWDDGEPLLAEGYLAQSAWNAATETAKPRWIPVSERLPTELQPCVVKVDGNSCPLVRFYLPGTKKWLSVNQINVTHWMEIPE